MQTSPTYQRFKRSEEWRKHLNSLLEDEVMKVALEAVASCASPHAMPQHVPGQAYDITIAHDWHEKLGINTALKLLKGLASDAADSPEDETEEEWAHLLPPELQ